MKLCESGLIPDSLIRQGIRALLRQRLSEFAGSPEVAPPGINEFISLLRQGAVAEVPEKANEQHYEIPQEFFRLVLGKHRKYSCCQWQGEKDTLDAAEARALKTTAERAGLENGQNILELGCGWGSLTLWMAENYPQSTITAVSNSASQGEFIRGEARSKNLSNLRVITADMNDFGTEEKYDRVVSVEMFEHMRNWPELFRRISGWLKPDGLFFMHVFTHRDKSYLFEIRDESDWMSRYFFSGGMMPGAELPLYFQDHLRFEKRWKWNGKNYARTADAWLKKTDANRTALIPVLAEAYGEKQTGIWLNRWRIFFLACSELFAFRDGEEWFVSHYLFSNRS